MKVLFIVNPNSGLPKNVNIQQLLSSETHGNIDYHIYSMNSNDEEGNIKSQVSSYQPDLVAVAGGDGSVKLLAKILIGTEIPLLIIPCGSANGMAKELGILSCEQAIGLINNSSTQKIDVLKINGEVCIHLADVGLNAQIVKRFKEDSNRGLYTYAKYLWREIFLIRQHRFNILYDSTNLNVKAVSLTFANASKYGTGAIINPLGKINDGKFELVIVKPFPRIQIFSIAWKMFRGTLNNSEYVQVISCREARIYSRKKNILQIDGEVIGKVRDIKIEIVPGQLQMIVPENFK